jgi:CheY-like chemotaxis protein
MRLLDENIASAVALVVDGDASSRVVRMTMLRDCGVGSIVQATRPHDARRLIESRRFDIIVCSFHFDRDATTGLELMDDLRQAGLPALSTVVVMITSEAAYGRVAEAAEAALDAYLIKPHTEAALRDRLREARLRKQLLADVISRVDAKQYEAAVELALAHVDARGPAWLQAARIGAELCLRLGQPARSASLLETILQAGALPWARLGLARAQVETGAALQARRTLESLLSDHPGYADAYDVMGRVLLDQGETWQAIEALNRAIAITPNSVTRRVKLGLLIFYFGDPRESLEHLEQAVRLGLNSRVFDLQGLVLLAALQFDRRDRRALAVTAHSMSRMRAPVPGSSRLRRFESVVQMLHGLLQRNVPEVVLALREMMDESLAPDFEFEAACNLLMVLSRINRAELHLADLDDQVVRLAERFAVSRTTCELLCGALRGDMAAVSRIRGGYARIGAISEEAVSLTISGRPRESVELLLAQARRTLNAKLKDLALHTLDRHEAAIVNAQALRDEVTALQQRYGSYGTQVRLARIDDARSMNAAARPSH